MPPDSDSGRPRKKQGKRLRNAGHPDRFPVPIYCHALDPRRAYVLAGCLGRPVALGMLDLGHAKAALMLFALRELGDSPYDPSGLQARMSWALNDAVSEAKLRHDLFPMKLTWALVDRLRGMAANLTPEQHERALDGIEDLVMSIYEGERKPVMSDELDAVASNAYLSASQRVARERRR